MPIKELKQIIKNDKQQLKDVKPTIKDDEKQSIKRADRTHCEPMMCFAASNEQQMNL